MNSHPLNLALRAVLELLLIFIYFYWPWKTFLGASKLVISIGLPILLVSVWAVFKVDGDPGKAVVAIPGWSRLILEACIFLGGFFLLTQLSYTKQAYLFLGISILHYIISYDRIAWLLKH
jgi:hypothetical protein